MSNPWFRMYHEFASDPKVQMLSEVDQRRFVMLLCLKCGNGDVTLQDEEVAFQLRVSNEEWLETKQLLIKKKLITEGNQPTNWDKRQFRSDTSNERVKAHRERARAKKASEKKEKEEAGNDDVTLQKRNVNALDTDTDTDTDTEIIKNILSDADASNPPVEQNQSDEILNLDSDSTLDNSTGTPTCPSKQIIELYNEILPELPRVMKITDSRTQATRNRWKQDPEHQSLEFWRAFFHHVRKSDFLMGRTQKPFSCSYDWIMKQANFVKIYEGNYHQ